jgi:hypothetical protein
LPLLSHYLYKLYVFSALNFNHNISDDEDLPPFPSSIRGKKNSKRKFAAPAKAKVNVDPKEFIMKIIFELILPNPIYSKVNIGMDTEIPIGSPVMVKV